MIKLNKQFLTLITVIFFLTACESLPFKKSDHNKTPETPQPVPTETIKTAVTTPSQYNTVWERMRTGYALPNTSNDLIDAQLKFFTANKAYFYKVTQESEPYLYYVVKELQANNMPLELSLLPFIESAYNPSATSPGNAGMWQIAAGTGKVFGLEQTRWYDGRKDVISSTEVAIRLLKKLNKMFDGDWFLTIAAYNGGEGTVQQAIDKNKRLGKPTDFWSLPLHKTTQAYIPQLLALSKIVADPERYNYRLHPIADQPYFARINSTPFVNLSDAVRNANIDPGIFRKLNAGMNTWITSPAGPHPLLVPVADAAAFTLQLESLPKLSATKWQEHIVKKGDTIDAIAKTYGVSTAEIKKINNLASNSLSIGQRLQISSLSNNSVTSDPQSVSPAKSTNEINTQYHTVKSGENLWTIAKAKNMTVASIAQMNNISIKTQLKPGQKLVVETRKK